MGWHNFPLYLEIDNFEVVEAEIMSIRTIMIFPEFDNMNVIDGVRKKYDPLNDLVRPHITLVFPFQSDITNEELIKKLDNCLERTMHFKLVLYGVSKQKEVYGNYIFLNVAEGYNELTNIHDNLYIAIWGHQNNHPYVPHMTIGKVNSEVEMDKAFSEIEDIDIRFETSVKKISVEMIGEHGKSIIIIEKELL